MRARITTGKFKAVDEDGNEYDAVKFDGYDIGERLLEGVYFSAFKLVDNRWCITLEMDNYTKKLNVDHWLDAALDYFSDVEMVERLERPDNLELVAL